MSNTRFLVSPVDGPPVLGIVIPADGPTFTVHLGGKHPAYDDARMDGYRVEWEPSPHWRPARAVELPLLLQELDPEDWQYLPDVARETTLEHLERIAAASASATKPEAS